MLLYFIETNNLTSLSVENLYFLYTKKVKFIFLRENETKIRNNFGIEILGNEIVEIEK